MTIRHPKFQAHTVICVPVWILLCLVAVSAKSAVVVQASPPILISQETSTRAIALDSLSFTSEPFALTSPYAAAGSDQRTRVMLFAMNLRLQPGEDLTLVTADAESGSHQHYNLTVEYVGAVPNQEWLSAVVLRLNDNLGDVGDVLVSVSYRGSSSNRVRVGIGHVGGGLPDDPGATPTPVKPFKLGGQIRDDNNGLLAGIELTLTDRTDGTTSTATTAADGSFLFSVAPGHNFTLTPTATPFLSFNAQAIESISGDRVMDFTGIRRTYSISGRLTGSINRTNGLPVNLSGFLTAATITNNNGDFVFAGLLAGHDYTISVPTSPHYTFGSQSFSNLSSNQVANFSGTLRSYTINGRAQLGPNAASGLLIPISGSQTLTITADDDGRYSITLPAGGNYTLAPSLPFWDFVPTRWEINDLTSDLNNRNFTGYRKSYIVSGVLKDDENHALAGQKVGLTSSNYPGFGRVEAVTDSNGYYEFQLFAGYSWTFTPVSNAAYKFPGPQTFAELDGNKTLNFLGLRQLALQGTVRDVLGHGIVGVTVKLEGTESATVFTAADGSYSLTASATGNYTVTPSIAQDWFAFAPANRQFNNLSVSQITDFSATLAPVPDPPYVLEYDGSPKTVDYGNFWPAQVNLGHFFWEFWAMPGNNAGATYMLSDGYGGAHALLFGVGSFNSSEPNRYEMLGNIYDGITHEHSFGSDFGPSVGEWAHLAVGWDGQNIVTYYNGVPAGKVPFAGPRISPGPGAGSGRLLIGGSDHSNFDGRIAQVRGYEGTNPREDAPGGVETSFAPQTVFALGGNLLSYYFRQAPVVADLSLGYNGMTHSGSVRGTTAGVLFDCGGCPPPQFVIDPSAPNFATATPPLPASLPSAAPPPVGSLVFDSFSRTNSTYTFGGNGGLGSTESGSAGTQVWQTNQAPASPQPFGILNSRAVLLANSKALAWVPTGSATGNVDVRVNRAPGRWHGGVDTGLSFRVVDVNNFFFAYTTDSVANPSSKIVHVGYYSNGQRTDLTNGAAIPSSWTTLRVVTTSSGSLSVYVDGTLAYSTNNPLMATATGAGLYSDSAGMGLVNRWDNFTVFAAP